MIDILVPGLVLLGLAIATTCRVRAARGGGNPKSSGCGVALVRDAVYLQTVKDCDKLDNPYQYSEYTHTQPIHYPDRC
jgi:hypothetical protein